VVTVLSSSIYRNQVTL